jgi:hypothetical protein
MNIGKLFIIAGILFLIIGLIWTSIGKLPGDITFKKGNVSIYFPIMTSIVISIVLTLIIFIISKFR